MSADLIARLVIFLIATGVAGAEVYFVRHAEDVSAKVLDKSLHRGTTKTESFGTVTESFSYRMTVRLDAAASDGREATLGLSTDGGKAIQEGDTVSVVALAHKPGWIFWQSMVRSPETAREPIRRTLAFGFLALATVFVGYRLI